jgi:hypothetical protein
MITIDQLLESVDLDFEPRWVTKDESGEICIWDCNKPELDGEIWNSQNDEHYEWLGKIKLAEFDGKDWTECIYEVPRKTTGKIKKLECYELADKEFNPTGKFEPMCFMTLIQTINSLVDAVNELKGAKNE